MDCIFCKIVEGTIPSAKVYEDEKVVAFKDINPEAPVHIIIIPKEHIESVREIDENNALIVSHIILTAKKIAKDLGISESGFRIVNNCGKDGGQTVPHLHFHLLGGRDMQWPPG
ncbi:histidine triad (HIT) family protein [Caloramator quimbayensis]|uniref:Histidine triad (HIT) family protein n=1 Tax=Caloramator quimbayensis TaxID=1147123 RepID=A0A1T4X8V4_9CLOT|nr:histidine triad nucleotide-binding protein [Caloramator quimbayensis]SKA85879.1 histidine triad (HIT) family protein [Caloramator quimbayensis]